MKRTISLLTAALLLMAFLPFGTFASDDAEYVRGTCSLYAENADEAVIDGKSYAKSGAEITLTIKLNATGVDASGNFLYFKNEEVGLIKNGENTYEIPVSSLAEGENEFQVRLIATNGVPGEIKYGTYNIDDMTVTSFSYSAAGSAFKSPKAVVKYLPVADDIGFNEVRTAYADKTDVGDGWNSETGMGGSTPETPVMLGYFIDKPDGQAVFSVDTKALSDGEHTVIFKKNGAETEKRTVIVDNTYPEIKTELTTNEVSYTAADSALASTYASVDGKKISRTSFDTSELAGCEHVLYVKAADKAGNVSEKAFVFKASNANTGVTLAEDGTVTAPEGAEVKLYTAQSCIEVNAYANDRGSFGAVGLRSEDEVLVPLTGTEIKSTGNFVPYQAFVINVGDNERIVIDYGGVCSENGLIELSVYSYEKGCWESIGFAESSQNKSFSVTTAGRVTDGKMRIKASPYIESNGGDTIIWISDTQYYTRYEDLEFLYKDDMDYAVKQYNDGKAAYVLHTGDLVDQTGVGDAEAFRQFEAASKYQKILDDAGVPNGVVSGNHDIQHDTANYSFYQKYFPASRYENASWFGGSLADNTHHYDLVTVGGYDFIFLFVGCYKETDEEFICWANEVLKTYSNRNAVICTHEYILPSGEWSGDRAEVIWSKIAEPNENVKMILCGHNEGVCNQFRTTSDGRQVLEILADYQFAELKNDVQHIENNCTCDGEGFVRLLTVNDAKQLIVSTYSPSFDDYNYYPSYLDSFICDLTLDETPHSITTTSFKVCGDGAETDKIGGNAEAAYAVALIDGNETYSNVITLGLGASFEYETEAYTGSAASEAVKVESNGYPGVSPSLRRLESGKDDENALVEKLVDLMPSVDGDLIKTSGNATYSAPVGERGFDFNHDGTTANWVTLMRRVNKKITVSEGDRLYFSVTADSPNTKWNMSFNVSGKKSLDFSQFLYKEFGYNDSAVPSDIVGTWSGYIDLAKYYEGEITVASVYYVVANGNRNVHFDYFFIGKSSGETVTFVTDDETAYSFDVEKGASFDAIPDAAKYGYDFGGWYTDAEFKNKASFPSTCSQASTYYARFTPEKEAENAVYLSDEVDISGKVIYNRKVGLSPWVFVALIVVAAAAVATALLVSKRKEAKK